MKATPKRRGESAVQSLAIQRVPISSLVPDPANARTHPDRNLDAVVASLRRFGQAEPLIVQSGTRRVIGGHARLQAMKALGWTECDVVELEIEGIEATALGIALNRTAELAEWDEGVLARLLQELRVEDALDGVGYLDEEIDALVDGLSIEGGGLVEDPGPQDPPANPVSRTGDLWVLGDHRLLCGDSTSADDVARLLGGKRAKLLSTDPPYCVSYTGNDRPIHDGKPSGKDWTHVYREIDIADLGVFLDGVFTACLPHLAEETGIYVWHAHVQQPTIAAAFERHGLLLHQVIVWVKPTATFGHSYFRWRHEPCAFGWKKGDKPTHGVGQLDTVWECDWDGKARITSFHPCLHPDALVLTEAGYRPISSIAIGERVYTADGQFHPVTDVSSHPYQSAELVRIVAKGGNLATLASDNHPFLVWRPQRLKRRVIGGVVEWVRADELRVGDYTMTPVLHEPETDPFPERDDEFWFLFGLYLAQGSLQKAGHGAHCYPSFALHKQRQDLVARIHDQWESVGEYDPNDYGARGKGLTVMAFDAEAGAEFDALGGRHAHAKRLSPVVFQLPRAKRLAVLLGWLNGDGCRVHDRSYWQGKTCSPDLAAHLALLGESVGYKANLFRYDPPAELGSIQGRKFKSQRAEYDLYFFAHDPKLPRGRITHLEHDGRAYTLRYVKSVERVPYTGDVWNLSVEGSPSFQTAVGMSHNTSKPTRLFEIPIEQHTAPGDVVLEPFNGSGSQIIAAEKLGRRCFAMDIQPAFIDGTIDRWEKATGRQATLDGSGITFEAAKAERGVQ